MVAREVSSVLVGCEADGSLDWDCMRSRRERVQLLALMWQA